jgi:hypothetical protein
VCSIRGRPKYLRSDLKSDTHQGWKLSCGHDPQRTGWSPKETDINRENAGSMTLPWKTHLDNQPRELNSLTEAVVSEWVITDKGMKEIAVHGGRKAQTRAGLALSKLAERDTSHPEG